MKTNKISTKIKTLGALLVISIFIVISVTIYLNQQNVKDALIVNIAGKQRMLTQKMSKSILFLYQTRKTEFGELDNAVTEFVFGIDTLKDGNKLLAVPEAPTEDINAQISKVLLLWETFQQNIRQFKSALLSEDEKSMESSLKYISASNNELLKNVDMIVTLYTHHIENKTAFIKYFQYVAMAFMSLLMIYSILKLKIIEEHAKEFLEKSKQIGSVDFDQITPLDFDAESEIVEAATNLNCFISKVNSAMNYSQGALEQSKMASSKLEELTTEFDEILNEISDKSVLSQLDKSEDIVIESSEELLKSTKKLQNLKDELDKLLLNCQN